LKRNLHTMGWLEENSFKYLYLSPICFNSTMGWLEGIWIWFGKVCWGFQFHYGMIGSWKG